MVPRKNDDTCLLSMMEAELGEGGIVCSPCSDEEDKCDIPTYSDIEKMR